MMLCIHLAILNMNIVGNRVSEVNVISSGSGYIIGDTLIVSKDILGSSKDITFLPQNYRKGNTSISKF